MLKLRLLGVLTSFVVITIGCSKKGDDQPQVFDPIPLAKPVPASFPGEVSGMADSYLQPGFIWMLQDGGTPAELVSVSHSGEQGPTLAVAGATNQDWEDLAISNGPVPGRKYLYIGDVGDNDRIHENYFIYRVEEPAAGEENTAMADKFRFVYEDDMKHDADAILVDPATLDILIVTKETPTLVFELRYPYSSTETNTATKIGQLPGSMITGGAIAPSGLEILLRTYSEVYYWKRQSGQSIFTALQEPATEIKVVHEPQGESICFKNDNSGFYTFSEKAGLPLQLSLNFYARK